MHKAAHAALCIFAWSGANRRSASSTDDADQWEASEGR
jgi:hypothetical protein